MPQMMRATFYFNNASAFLLRGAKRVPSAHRTRGDSEFPAYRSVKQKQSSPQFEKRRKQAGTI